MVDARAGHGFRHRCKGQNWGNSECRLPFFLYQDPPVGVSIYSPLGPLAVKGCPVNHPLKALVCVFVANSLVLVSLKPCLASLILYINIFLGV